MEHSIDHLKRKKSLVIWIRYLQMIKIKFLFLLSDDFQSQVFVMENKKDNCRQRLILSFQDKRINDQKQLKNTRYKIEKLRMSL